MNTILRHIALSLTLLVAGSVSAQAVYVDPTLTASVIAQTEALKDIGEKRNKLHDKIITAELGVTVALEQVHAVEKKALDYLSNAQGAMQNLYQIKRATQLVTVEIPKNIERVTKAVPGNFQGTVVSAIVSDRITDVATEMASLYPFMKQLVTSGSFETSDGNGGTKSKKVNLLNAAERYHIASTIVNHLEKINRDLLILSWEIKCLTWNDLWRGLDPEGWAYFISTRVTMDDLIYRWKNYRM